MIDPKHLAKRALAEVAKGTLENYFYKADVTSSIYESILEKDIESQIGLMNIALEKGLTLDFFYNSIAPMIAEKLGDAWKEDTLSFSEVTVALGKLRLLCQEFEEKYFSDSKETFNGYNILMVSPAEDNHTFGAYIASLRLRKFNINAHLAVARKESEILDILENGNFVLVGVSVGSEKIIESTNRLVRAIKKHHNIPVIAGGSFVSNNMEIAKKVLEVDATEFEPKNIKTYIKLRHNTN